MLPTARVSGFPTGTQFLAAFNWLYNLEPRVSPALCQRLVAGIVPATNRWQRAGETLGSRLLALQLSSTALHTVDVPAVRTAAKTVLSWRHWISLWTKWRNFVVLEYRTLKYSKIIIKNLYFILFLVEVSGPWLKKKNTSINNRSLQRFKRHNELEIGTTVFLHALILTAKLVGKYWIFILCQMIHWIWCLWSHG